MRLLLPGAVALSLAACGSGDAPDRLVAGTPQQGCVPGLPPLVLSGSVARADAKTYRMLPFQVGAGTGRVELYYSWTEKAGPPSTPATATTLDLGLWDQNGYRSPSGFRGWGGSRQGRSAEKPIFVETGVADRGFVAGPITPGTWYADLGIAAVSPQGADWTLTIECKAAGGTLPLADPVNASHVASNAPGWYHGDFHMHAYHSNPNAPDWEGFIAQSRTAGLEFLMVTEYVTGEHWRTLGALQRAHPDLVLWPGREIITYFGHASSHGETPEVLEYRHGFEDVNLGNIQQAVKAGGALFQINHPTSFPGPVFENFCRGCEFTLGDQIDWSQVDTMEVLNGPVLATGDDIGAPVPGQIENPFMTTALQLWEEQLLAGHKITAVSGSDSKGVDAEDDRARKGYGSSATVVYAENLSRAALRAGIQAGHAYIKTRGKAGSPSLAFSASGPRGQTGIFGDTLLLADGETATLTTTVTGGSGQFLSYILDGVSVLTVPVTSADFTHSFPLAARNPLTEGPLGSFWRVEVRDAQTRTALGNPIFLKAPSP